MFVVVRKGFERITLIEAVQEFGADAVRLGLADAGDDFKDANFVASTCNSAMLTLYNLWDFYVISSLLLSWGQTLIPPSMIVSLIMRSIRLCALVTPLMTLLSTIKQGRGLPWASEGPWLLSWRYSGWWGNEQGFGQDLCLDLVSNHFAHLWGHLAQSTEQLLLFNHLATLAPSSMKWMKG